MRTAVLEGLVPDEYERLAASYRLEYEVKAKDYVRVAKFLVPCGRVKTAFFATRTGQALLCGLL